LMNNKDGYMKMNIINGSNQQRIPTYPPGWCGNANTIRPHDVQAPPKSQEVTPISPDANLVEDLPGPQETPGPKHPQEIPTPSGLQRVPGLDAYPRPYMYSKAGGVLRSIGFNRYEGTHNPQKLQGSPDARNTAGTGCFPSFSYIYSTDDQVVMNHAAIVFHSPSNESPIAFTTGTPMIKLAALGSYYISFLISSATDCGGEWAIAVNHAISPSLSYNNTNGFSQIHGEAIINVTTIPTEITIVNLSGVDMKLSNGLSSGEKLNTTVSASVTILKLN
jgi:hypothetical protein